MGGIRTKPGGHEPRKRPAQARSRATVDAILEAAAQVFARLGYDETTTDRIAERAGVSIGSLYQYYADKDAILVALFEQHLADAEAHFDALAALLAEGASTDAVIVEMVSRTFALHRDGPELHRILVERAPLPERLLMHYRGLENRLRAAWVKHLEGHVGEPELVAFMLTSLVETMAHRYTLYPPPDRAGAELESETVAVLAAYVRSRFD